MFICAGDGMCRKLWRWWRLAPARCFGGEIGSVNSTVNHRITDEVSWLRNVERQIGIENA